LNENKELSNTDEFLNDSYGAGNNIITVSKQKKSKKSKIEIAGPHVTKHLMKLGMDGKHTYQAMASRLNEAYNLKLTKSDVVYFFRSNAEAIQTMNADQQLLTRMRAKIHLDHNAILVQDMQRLNKLIEDLDTEEFMETTDKIKDVTKAIDQRRRILETHARLSGELKEKIDPKVQVNIIQQINTEKSDIINRLKKAEFNSVIK